MREDEASASAREGGPIRPRLAYANVVSSICLFLVLTGGAALVLALGLLVGPAEGTFPGRNGQIVFEQYRDGTGYQIAIMGPTGSNPHQLTTDGGSSPTISPDGSHVVYTAEQSCGPQVRGCCTWFIMRSDGSDPRPLTRPLAGREDDEASFSPDGRSVVFSPSLRAQAGHLDDRYQRPRNERRLRTREPERRAPGRTGVLAERQEDRLRTGDIRAPRAVAYTR